MAEGKVEPSTCTDWAKCILCQDKTKEALQCPGNTLRGHVEYGSGYHTLANNILRFNELRCLPTHSDLEIAKLEEGDGIAATSIKRNAKWHETWSNTFNNLKWQQAEKKKVLKTLSFCQLSLYETVLEGRYKCQELFFFSFFFVTMPQVLDLHHASTFNMGERVRKCPILLQDRVLLAYLSADDLIFQEAVYHSNWLVTLYNKALKLERNNSSKASHWHR